MRLGNYSSLHVDAFRRVCYSPRVFAGGVTAERSAGKGYMPKGEVIEVEAIVKASLPNAMFRLEIEVGENTHEIIGHISGKMRRHYIRITPGDKVLVQLSPYDLTKGRIVYRQR